MSDAAVLLLILLLFWVTAAPARQHAQFVRSAASRQDQLQHEKDNNLI
jgi:hypothetical protein